MLGDSNYLPRPLQWLDPRKTVFVGALHGMLNAEGLATIFGDLFGGKDNLFWDCHLSLQVWCMQA